MSIINYISTFISIVAIGISTLAYRLSLKLPNENKIFEEKIKTYHELIKAMNTVIVEILICINSYVKLKKEEAPELENEADQLPEVFLNKIQVHKKPNQIKLYQH